MSSAYSNLKFELIATGEQNGTWGATTNSNIGTAIEQAIVGMATLTSSDFTANVATLSLTNTTAAQNARALCLVVGAGAVSAAGTIEVPAIEKPYIIINNSSYAVTVKVSGQTGVAVPAGKRTVVYNDGTDVGAQITHLTNLTLATDLAVADGGTGASSFTSGGLLRGNGSSALSVASASDIVTQIGSTAVTNATNATNATTAAYATYSGYSNSVSMSASTPDLALKVPYTSTTASTAGQYGLVIEPGSTFTYNPFTATLTVNNIVGDLDGTATYATYAINAYASLSNTSSAFKVPFLNTTASTAGNYGLLQDSAATFTYNPSTNTLNVPNITADTLTANNVTATAVHVGTTSGNFKYKVPFTGTTTSGEGDYSLYMDSTTADFTYNPSTNTLAVSSITLGTANVPTLDGTAPGYLARAWVNFNGTGTVAIRSSGNVTSITDNGTGDYTINFSTAMSDANYAVSGACGNADTSVSIFQAAYGSAPTASACRVSTQGGFSNADRAWVSVSIFR